MEIEPLSGAHLPRETLQNYSDNRCKMELQKFGISNQRSKADVGVSGRLGKTFRLKLQAVEQQCRAKDAKQGNFMNEN